MLDLDGPNLRHLLQRRKASLVLPVLAGLVVAGIAYKMLTPQYRATTTVMVEQQQIPENYVMSTVSTSSAERLITIEQQISSRAPLRLIIEELNLYPELQGKVPMEVLIRKARQALSVRVTRGAVFSISFKGPDPKTVAAAANRVADLFTQENLRLRESQAQNTSAFLDAETADLKEKVQAQQDRIVSFRTRHEGELPEQKPIIAQGIGQLEQRLEILGESIHNAELRKLVLETNADMPRQGSSQREPSRLTELRAQLADLLLQFTERHPDVVRVRSEIDALLEQTASISADPNPISVAPLAVELEIDKIALRIENLQAEREETLEGIADYQRRLERIPRLEQELKTLTSDFQNLQGKYRSMQAKQLEAQLSENLERSQQAEQFRVLDRAIPPIEPYFPNLMLLLGVGIASGLIIGTCVGLLREQIDETFTDARSLRKAFPGVHIMASVPEMSKLRHGSPKKHKRKKRRIA